MDLIKPITLTGRMTFSGSSAGREGESLAREWRRRRLKEAVMGILEGSETPIYHIELSQSVAVIESILIVTRKGKEAKHHRKRKEYITSWLANRLAATIRGRDKPMLNPNISTGLRTSNKSTERCVKPRILVARRKLSKAPINTTEKTFIMSTQTRTTHPWHPDRKSVV